MTAEKLSKPLAKVTEEVATPMEEAYGDVYTALEEANRQGSEALTKIGISSEVAEVLAKLAKEKIRLPQVKIKGVLQLTSTKPDGVNIVRKALQMAQKASSSKTAKTYVYSIAAPKYLLSVEAENYKQAENMLDR